MKQWVKGIHLELPQKTELKIGRNISVPSLSMTTTPSPEPKKSVSIKTEPTLSVSQNPYGITAPSEGCTTRRSKNSKPIAAICRRG